MSYDLSLSDDSFLNNYIPEIVSSNTIDYNFLFDLPLSPVYDSSSDYNLQALLNSNQNQQNPVDQLTCPDQLDSDLLPSSPSADLLETLSRYQTTQFPSLSFGRNLENGYENFNTLNCFEVKKEECQVDFDSAYSDVENVPKHLQWGFSSNSFEGKPKLSFQPPFDSLMESQNFQGQALSMPENSFFAGQMRKNMRNVHMNKRSISTPWAIEKSFMEEAPFKVARYNPEERQERISKYRAKRNQRNFNKKIKYACRKTLADNRLRFRGRFTRNDETVEIPKASCSTRDEDEDDYGRCMRWRMKQMARGTFMNISFNTTMAASDR